MKAEGHEDERRDKEKANQVLSNEKKKGKVHQNQGKRDLKKKGVKERKGGGSVDWQEKKNVIFFARAKNLPDSRSLGMD